MHGVHARSGSSEVQSQLRATHTVEVLGTWMNYLLPNTYDLGINWYVCVLLDSVCGMTQFEGPDY